MSDFDGDVVVVNVWGSWCGPCRGEADLLQRTYEQTRDQGVAFLGINLRDNRGAARDFVADRGITYPSIYDSLRCPARRADDPDVGGPDDGDPRPSAPSGGGVSARRRGGRAQRGRQPGGLQKMNPAK